MKIILSHDVDHLYWSEHYLKDFYVSKLIFRNLKALFCGKISILLFIRRIKVWGRLHQLPELMSFYKEKGLSANFFFGMDNALGLSYSYKNTKYWIRSLENVGHKVSVHGIETRKISGISKEFNRFTEISGHPPKGVRTHYLRLSGYTYALFEHQGYCFDSSMEGLYHPFQFGSLWEIPISIMDVSLVKEAQFNHDANAWDNNTQIRLHAAKEAGLPFFVINFHDIYFNNQYPTIRDWYIRTINKLEADGYSFITFDEALQDLTGFY
jgi:hypothetical protein